MARTEDRDFDGFFTMEDFESFKQCSQVKFRNVAFHEGNIATVTEKQNFKKLLSFLFRAGTCAGKNVYSKDNWYSYFVERNHVRLACLHDDMERDNAVLKTMQHIKRDTGFQAPYVLLRFDLYYDVADMPAYMAPGDEREVESCRQALKLTEKYMQFLALEVASGVDRVMKDLGMPKLEAPVACALITDTPTEYWSYYVLTPSSRFDLTGWVVPEAFREHD